MGASWYALVAAALGLPEMAFPRLPCSLAGAHSGFGMAFDMWAEEEVAQAWGATCANEIENV